MLNLIGGYQLSEKSVPPGTSREDGCFLDVIYQSLPSCVHASLFGENKRPLAVSSM